VACDVKNDRMPSSRNAASHRSSLGVPWCDIAERPSSHHFIIMPPKSSRRAIATGPSAYTPANYVDEIALRALRDFKAEPRSRRRAYQACQAIFHIKDHLSKAGEDGIEDQMREAAGASFDVVRAICNGTKHVETDASHPIAFKAGEDWDRPPATLGQLMLGVSRLGDVSGGREIGQGPNRFDLYEACKSTYLAFCAAFPIHLGRCDTADL